MSGYNFITDEYVSIIHLSYNLNIYYKLWICFLITLKVIEMVVKYRFAQLFTLIPLYFSKMCLCSVCFLLGLWWHSTMDFFWCFPRWYKRILKNKSKKQILGKAWALRWIGCVLNYPCLLCVMKEEKFMWITKYCTWYPQLASTLPSSSKFLFHLPHKVYEFDYFTTWMSTIWAEDVA